MINANQRKIAVGVSFRVDQLDALQALGLEKGGLSVLMRELVDAHLERIAATVRPTPARTSPIGSVR